MIRIDLPTPGSQAVPPFADPAGARAWLKTLPQAEPMRMQNVLLHAVAAVDAAQWTPAGTVSILETLRGPICLAQAALEGRYARKPVPLLMGDRQVLDTTCRLWRTLAVAYLRAAAALPPGEEVLSALCMHRAAVALRSEQAAHFQAAAELSPEISRLLYGILSAAESSGIAHHLINDPDPKQYAESDIAGQVAWALLLQFADPYRMSASQLAVTSRMFGRWRDLAVFERMPGEKAIALPLAAVMPGDALNAGGLRWLDVKPVMRKLKKRRDALEAGESPEILKLGRELSAAACLRLIQRLDEGLRPEHFLRRTIPRGNQPLQVVFGPERAYELLAGRKLEPDPAGTGNRAVDHQRMAIFGFDPAEVAARQKSAVATERWAVADDCHVRSGEGMRLSAPCLVAGGEAGESPRLGVLSRLQAAADGSLKGCFDWLPPVSPDSFTLPDGRKMPAFLLGGDTPSLILPTGSGLIETSVRLTEVGQKTLGPVLERGTDFVRYAI